MGPALPACGTSARATADDAEIGVPGGI